MPSVTERFLSRKLKECAPSKNVREGKKVIKTYFLKDEFKKT